MTPVLSATARRRQRQILLALGACALAVLVLSCLVGSVSLPLAELPASLWQIVRGEAVSMDATLLELRLSRAASAFATGAGLSLAGVMMQALLRNPLADPYVLGISSGAAVGALCALLLGAALWLVDLAALGGALGIALLLYALARRDLGGQLQRELAGDTSTLLLTGVILASACMALVTLMLSIAPDSRLRGMVFWMIGDLGGVQWRLLPWLLLGGALLFARRQARAMNVLALHAEAAAALGVHVARLRRALFICAGLLTAGAVTTAGAIGFVGLIVPHACRIAFGPDHRLLLPASALAGGAFLVLADTLARSLLAPQQLPVGVLTALIGVPIFLIQLHQLHRVRGGRP
ncbi:iron ABC transporter permease [Massilia sp. TS11]|uniref:FecCD family ABC transporter permease n=1 Tax=Massilia sp. TS11 TaxID=2908003 RepID=UPI001EDB0398|nr:iron ABC transporter permease [Massilia sp. TS11]MCG2585563.1 iron ABC transporter permease [Massilia sp. TS11]